MANLLDSAAKKIIRDVLFVSKRDKILIITDKKRKKIGDILFKEAAKITESFLVFIPVAKYPGEEPPRKIGDLMLKYNKIIAPTSGSLTHTKVTNKAFRKGAIIATLPGITEEIMKKSINISYKDLMSKNNDLYKKLRGTKKNKINTNSSTFLEFRTRKWIKDSGNFKKEKVGNLPAGEVFTAPCEESCKGQIVIDWARHNGVTYASKGTKILIDNGSVISISRRCELSKIFKNIKNSKNIAEFGIGTNPKAKLIGNILQDEKANGTCHIAFGNNTSMGGLIYSKIHLDTILIRPTIYADNKKIMKNGRLIV